MGLYILKRIVGTIPTLTFILILVFFVMRLAPGGPFDDELIISPEIKRNLENAYHLNDPLWRQFLNYVIGILHFDFGPSFQYKDFSVSELILSSFPISFKIGGMALIIALMVGCALGIVAAWKKNTWIDYWVIGFSTFGVSIPTLVFAPLTTFFFGVYLGILPVGGWDDHSIQFMILPVLSLCLPQIASISRLMRGSMIEVLSSNFIRTAKAKGLPNYKIILKHALKPAILPVVSYLGPATAFLLTGSVVVEKVFGIPGTARYFVHGALARDYTLVMGVVLFYGIILISLNLMVDIIYAFLDPRITYQESE